MEVTGADRLSGRLRIDNVIDGEALVRLNHDDLRELGITSIGHRLSILKAVYTVKVAHDVPMDPDDYIPVCRSLFFSVGCFSFLFFSYFSFLLAPGKIKWRAKNNMCNAG